MHTRFITLRPAVMTLRPLVAALVAATLAVPALGQTTGVISAPGMAAAARVETASATVTAIDLATREVTLRRANGTTFTVVAGPDARNLPQLRVGDTVTIDFYDALTLELKKGGTGAPASRSDALAGSRAELGQRPGGIATRERVIVADVIAVDPTRQTVSLRGVGGKVLDLPVKDPEQFRRIAVGDQVQATYVEAVALSITPTAAPPAPAPVMAPAVPPWGRWMVGARVVNINPDVSSSVSGFEVKDQWTGEFDTTYFFTPNVAIEGSITWAKQDVNFNGTGLGSLKMMPVIFTAQYHFFDVGNYNPAFAHFKPYIGGGFNYTYFYETDLGGNSGADVNRDSWGGALQAGFDYQFQRNWNFNMDVKYLWISNDVHFKATGGTPSSLDIDPWVYGVGIRYRF